MNEEELDEDILNDLGLDEETKTSFREALRRRTRSWSSSRGSRECRHNGARRIRSNSNATQMTFQQMSPKDRNQGRVILPGIIREEGRGTLITLFRAKV